MEAPRVERVVEALRVEWGVAEVDQVEMTLAVSNPGGSLRLAVGR